MQTYLEQFKTDEEVADQTGPRILLLQLDMSKPTDSTSLEKYLRTVIDLEKMDLPAIINCSGYGSYFQVCEDKLYHELQFD